MDMRSSNTSAPMPPHDIGLTSDLAMVNVETRKKAADFVAELRRRYKNNEQGKDGRKPNQTEKDILQLAEIIAAEGLRLPVLGGTK